GPDGADQRLDALGKLRLLQVICGPGRDVAIPWFSAGKELPARLPTPHNLPTARTTAPGRCVRSRLAELRSVQRWGGPTPSQRLRRPTRPRDPVRGDLLG